MALKFDRLEQMDGKTLVTEPINVFALSMGLPMGLIGALNPGTLPNAKAAQQASRGDRAADAAANEAATERLAIVPASHGSGALLDASGFGLATEQDRQLDRRGR